VQRTRHDRHAAGAPPSSVAGRSAARGYPLRRERLFLDPIILWRLPRVGMPPPIWAFAIPTDAAIASADKIASFLL